jgi:hypothetical protein
MSYAAHEKPALKNMIKSSAMIQKQAKPKRAKRETVLVPSADYKADKSVYITRALPSECRSANVPWTTMINCLHLSAAADGLLHRLASKPPNFRWSSARLDATKHGLSRRARDKALKELEDLGILKRLPARNAKNGQMTGYVWLIDMTVLLDGKKPAEALKTKASGRIHRIASIRGPGCWSRNKGNVDKQFPTLFASEEGFQGNSSSPLPNPEGLSEQVSPVPGPCPSLADIPTPPVPSPGFTGSPSESFQLPGFAGSPPAPVQPTTFSIPDHLPGSPEDLTPRPVLSLSEARANLRANLRAAQEACKNGEIPTGLPPEQDPLVIAARQYADALDASPEPEPVVMPEQATLEVPTLIPDKETYALADETQAKTSHTPRTHMTDQFPVTVAITRKDESSPLTTMVYHSDLCLPSNGSKRVTQLAWVQASRVAYLTAKLFPGATWNKTLATQLVRNLRGCYVPVSQIPVVVDIMKMNGGLSNALPWIKDMRSALRSWEKIIGFCRTFNPTEDTFVAWGALGRQRALKKLQAVNKGDQFAAHLECMGATTAAAVERERVEKTQEDCERIVGDILKRFPEGKHHEGLDEVFFQGEDIPALYSWQTFSTVLQVLPLDLEAFASTGSGMTIKAARRADVLRTGVMKHPRLRKLFMEALTEMSHDELESFVCWGLDKDIKFLREVLIARSDFYTDLIITLYSDLNDEDVLAEVDELAQHGYLFQGINDSAPKP